MELKSKKWFDAYREQVEGVIGDENAREYVSVLAGSLEDAIWNEHLLGTGINTKLRPGARDAVIAAAEGLDALTMDGASGA